MNPGLEVMIVEKSSKLLSKVKVSGGGRCNVTHACFEIAEMVKKYPRGSNFIKKAFHQFFTSNTIEWFEERGVVLKKEDDGRMFPVSNSSQTIIDCLLKEADRYGVVVMMNTEVRSLKSEEGSRKTEAGSKKSEDGSQEHEQAADNKKEDRKIVLEILTPGTSDLRLLTSDFVCIASGGYPRSSMFDWIKQTGHTIADPVPSLFTFNMPGNAITKLMGISVEKVKLKIAGSKLESDGPLLITHWGLSGPAVLKLSAWGARELAEKKYAFTAIVNWLPPFNDQTLREAFQQFRFDIATQKIINRNPFALPQRLWEYFLLESGIKEDMRWADLPAAMQNKLIRNLIAQEFLVNGKTTFKEEFVTAGGVNLQEIDANTMMSKKLAGLFCR